MPRNHTVVRPPRARLMGALIASCFSAAAFANPTGPSVVSGTAGFATVGQTLTVTNSPNAIINWQGFSIGVGETTRFVQQSASSAVLNRVVGQDPSSILGTLSSNGHVYLVNPNGILFGQGSRVDVAGLVATTLNITNNDFLAGRLNFEAGAIANPLVNQGDIVTASGGRVLLLAPDVQNHGLISSPQGEVVLAAGKSVQLVEADLPQLKVEVQAGGEALNVGRILAEGGRIGVYAGLINQRGIVRADSASVDATGRIVFRSSDTTLLEEGSVTAATGAKGGEIQVLGDKVGLTGNALVDASGDKGGGTVLVGGDFQGRNPDVQNAYRTYFGPEATIKADAITSGDGGKVIVWSDDATRAYGQISARGGAQSGDGGFVEVSGKRWLDFAARVDTSAVRGATGTLLLDPNDVEIGGFDSFGGGSFDDSNPNIFSSGSDGISFISWSTITSNLSTAAVYITTEGDTPGTADITVAGNVTDLNSSNTLRLISHGNVIVNGTITNTGTGALEMYAGWDGASATSPTLSASGNIDINQAVSVAGTLKLVSQGAVTATAPVAAGTLELLGSGGNHALTNPANQIGTIAANTGSVTLLNNGALVVSGPASGEGATETIITASPSSVAGEQFGGSIAVRDGAMLVGAPGTFMTGVGAVYVYRWNGSAWVFEAKLVPPDAIARNFGAAVAVEGSFAVVGAPETSDVSSRSGAAYAYMYSGSWDSGTKLTFAEKTFESVFGIAVAIDNSRLVVGGNGRTINPTGFWTGRIWFYDLVGNSWVERGNAIQSDPVSNDYFGHEIAISGNRMIVGAFNASGKAYTFEFDPDTRVWVETQKLTGDVVNERFGRHVAISGDVAVVGAEWADPGGVTDGGKAYVFRHDGLTWSQEQVLVPSDVATSDFFGLRVAVRDSTIVATSYGANLPGVADAGAAYVFKHNGVQWVQDSKITGSNSVAGDQLGRGGLLLAEDGKLYIGAQVADPGGSVNAGAVYAYTLTPISQKSTLSGSLVLDATGDLTQSASVTAGGSVSYRGSNIAINAALNAASAVTLNSTGTISQTAAITASALELLGLGGIHNLTQSGNSIGTLSADTGSVNFVNNGAFAIGTAGTTTGIATAGNVTLANGAGDLDIAADITAGPGIIDVTGIAGMVTLSGTPTIASGNAGFGFLAGTLDIGAATATLNANTSVNALSLASGALGGSGLVTVGSAFSWTGGSMTGSGSTTIAPAATLSVSGPTPKVLSGGRVLDVEGTAQWAGGAPIDMQNASVNLVSGSLFDVQADGRFFDATTGASPNTITVQSGATLRKSGGAGISEQFGTATAQDLNNHGTVEVQTGTLLIAGASHSGTFSALPGTNFTFYGGANALQDGTLFTGGGTHAFVPGGGGSLSLAGTVLGTTIAAGTTFELSGVTVGGTGKLNNNGILDLGSSSLPGLLTSTGMINISGASSVAGGIDQQAGLTTLPSGQSLTVGGSGLVLAGGTLAGGGTIVGDVVNSGGSVIPGASAGILSIDGDYTQGAGGALTMEIGGTTAGTDYDQLAVTGAATLGGALTVLEGAVAPVPGTTYTLITCGTCTGIFSVVTAQDLKVTPAYGGTSFTLPFVAFLNLWSGGLLADWDNAANWSRGVPTSNDDVILDISGDATITITGTQAARSVVSEENLVLAGGSLNLAAPSVVNGAFTVSGGSLTGTGSLTVNGAFAWSSGSISNAGLTTTGTSAITGAGLVLGSPWTNSGTASVSGGELLASAGITNTGTFNLTGSGLIRLPLGGPAFANAAGGTLNIDSSAGWSFVSNSATQDGILTNAGTVNINGITSWEAAYTQAASGSLNIAVGQQLSLQNGKTIQGAVNLGAGSTLWVSERHGSNATFDGTAIGGSGRVLVHATTPVADFGNVSAPSATLEIGGGTVNILSGNSTFGSLIFSSGTLGGAGTLTVNGTLTQTGGVQTGGGTTVLGPSGTGSIGAVSVGRNLTNQGLLDLNGTSVSGVITNTGTLNLAGTVNAGGGILLNGGTLMGNATIVGNVDNEGGTVSPGASPGILTVNGDYTQGPSGTLAVEIGGTVPGTQYDQLIVNGNASLDGTLLGTLTGGYTPIGGESFTFISASGTISGSFATVDLPAVLQAPATVPGAISGTELVVSALGSGLIGEATTQPLGEITTNTTQMDLFEDPLLQELEDIQTLSLGSGVTGEESELAKQPPPCS